MRLPLKGGCQCGAIRYEIAAAPIAIYACYCQDCQRQSASAFGMSMPVLATMVRITAGTPRNWQRHAASGRVVACAFCPDCGTRLMHKPERNPAIVNIKPGTLDDTSWVKPVGHLWTRSAQLWTIPLHDGVVFEGQPSDFKPLYDAWKGIGCAADG